MSSLATSSSRDESRTIPVLTLVTWISFLAVGVVGLLLHYGKPPPPPKSPPPFVAQTLVVELTDDPTPPEKYAAPKTLSLQPPPMIPLPALPSAPPTIAVTAPSPAIAFAMPIKAPAQIIDAAQASIRTTPLTQTFESAPAAPPTSMPLTYGVGEGKQPAPEYPRLAMRQGQEGVVVVRMTVGGDGRVITVEAASPSPWPLLNDAALRVVRKRWRFSNGVSRSYEVAIRFQLNRMNS